MDRIKDEINALVNLLDDPDKSVRQPVVERLTQLGRPAVKLLEKTWETSSDQYLQSRIENVISTIQQGMVRKELKDWTDCRGEQLIYGAYLIAKSQYPALEFDAVDEQIEALRAQIWLELNDQLTAIEKVRIINHFLFSEHKFNRSVRGVQSPQLFFINHVLDTRKGLPVSLSIIYAEIAARLDMSVKCVDLPYNFLLCYHDPTYLDDPDGIMFYINPYTRGTILGRPEVTNFLKEQKLEIKHEYTQPCSNIEAIERLTEGLRFAYSASRMDEKAAFMEELLQIMRQGNHDQSW